MTFTVLLLIQAQIKNMSRPCGVSENVWLDQQSWPSSCCVRLQPPGQRSNPHPAEYRSVQVSFDSVSERFRNRGLAEGDAGDLEARRARSNTSLARGGFSHDRRIL